MQGFARLFARIGKVQTLRRPYMLVGSPDAPASSKAHRRTLDALTVG